MPGSIDITGKTFGRLTAIEPICGVGRKRKRRWRCKCACGAITEVPTSALICSSVKSCGCWKEDHPGRKRHGWARRGRKTPTYTAWAAMRSRCTNPNNNSYANYGGRGISYDPGWEYFEGFLADMGERPTNTSLDRIDNDGPYSKTNCRWASRTDQMRNRRNVRQIEFEGERKFVWEWAAEIGIPSHVLVARLRKGMPIEKALTLPLSVNASGRECPQCKAGMQATWKFCPHCGCGVTIRILSATSRRSKITPQEARKFVQDQHVTVTLTAASA